MVDFVLPYYYSSGGAGAARGPRAVRFGRAGMISCATPNPGSARGCEVVCCGGAQSRGQAECIG